MSANCSRHPLSIATNAARMPDGEDGLSAFEFEDDLPPQNLRPRLETNPLTDFRSESVADDSSAGSAVDSTWINPDDPLSDLVTEDESVSVGRRWMGRESQLRGVFDACVGVAAVFGLVMVLNDPSNPLGNLLRPNSMERPPTTPSTAMTSPLPMLRARAVARSFAPLLQTPWNLDRENEEIAVIRARYARMTGIPSFRTALVVRPTTAVLPLPALPPRVLATFNSLLTASLTNDFSPPSPPPLTASVVTTPFAPVTLDAPVYVGTTKPNDTGAIHTVLGRYRNAFSGLDSGAARAVWPSVDVRALDRAFDRLEEQALEFENCEIDVNGPRAVASCEGSARYVPKVGNRNAQVAARQWRFNLRKVNEAWLIEEVDSR